VSFIVYGKYSACIVYGFYSASEVYLLFMDIIVHLGGGYTDNRDKRSKCLFPALKRIINIRWCVRVRLDSFCRFRDY